MKATKVIALFCLCAPVPAATQIDALRTLMMDVRQCKPQGPRDSSPKLTIVKHQLRDWLASHFKELPWNFDEGQVERELNSELSIAELFCENQMGAQHPCPEWTNAGYLEKIQFHRSRGFVVVITGVGIECGYDESAYVYSHSDEGWQRVWQSEQNVYTDEAYKPQTISEVLISPYSQVNDYIVLTLGVRSWCSSIWHPVYYRAFRIGADANARALIDGEEFADVGFDPPIQGSVTREEVLVQFTVNSIDGGLISRTAIRHYRIDRGDKPRRIDPLALNPRDFVDEWLKRDWREAAFWSEDENRASASRAHKRLHKDSPHGEFIYPTMHCPMMPDLWQVGVDFSDPPTPIGNPPKGTYFLVRWQPPYRFRMVDVRERPFEGCTEEDRMVDDTPATLFPERDWR